jgi:hypothetical protein
MTNRRAAPTMRSPLPLLVLLLATLGTHSARAEEPWFLPAPTPEQAAAVAPAGQTPDRDGVLSAQPAALSLDLPFAVASAPPATPVASGPASVSASMHGDNQPATPAVRLARFSLEVGAAATMPSTDNPPVNMTRNLWGGDPGQTLPVKLGDRPAYSPSVDVRVPDHQFGIHADYRLTPDVPPAAPQVSIGASFGVSTYDPLETDHEGIATLRITF